MVIIDREFGPGALDGEILGDSLSDSDADGSPGSFSVSTPPVPICK